MKGILILITKTKDYNEKTGEYSTGDSDTLFEKFIPENEKWNERKKIREEFMDFLDELLAQIGGN